MKPNLRKSSLAVFAMLFAMVFFLVAILWIKQQPVTEKAVPMFKRQHHTALVIGIIGDSWVVRQNLAALVSGKLKEKKIIAEIISKGHPGGTSGEIYNDIFSASRDTYSSGFVLENAPDYCVITAGVNDAARHISPETYALHISYLIKLLQRNHITPVISVLPPVDIDKNTENKNIFVKTTNHISDYVLYQRKISVNDYRSALSRLFKEKKLENIIIVDFTSNCPKNRNCDMFFSDALHLNKKGYDIFAGQIADAISKDLNAKNRNK